MFDKENNLTFQNITQTMKVNKSRRIGFCCFHADRVAKYRNRENDIFYCVSCAIQEASRGAVIEDITKSQQPIPIRSSFGILQEVYQQSQDQLQEYIRLYNCRYQKLQEAITDLQIRDLITFNRKIEENHNLYKRLKEECSQNWDRQTLLKLFANQNLQPILNNIDQIVESIARTQCRNQQLSPQNRSRTNSPQLVSKTASPQPPSKNRLQTLEPQQMQQNISKYKNYDQIRVKETTRQSFTKSQANTNSFHSRTSTIQQNKKSILEDTPESVKLMVSQNGVRVTTDMAVTMFEKIDVCESVNLCQSLTEECSKGKASLRSLNRKNRYQSSTQI